MSFENMPPPPQQQRATWQAAPKLSKDHPDPQVRMEWQLNQIRINTLVVGAFFALAFIGTVLAALSSGR